MKPAALLAGGIAIGALAMLGLTQAIPEASDAGIRASSTASTTSATADRADGATPNPNGSPRNEKAPAPVSIVERVNALGPNSSDMSIRACTARRNGTPEREAEQAAQARDYDAGSARSVYGRAGASVQTITRCMDGSPVSIVIADLDGDALPEIVTHRIGGQTDIDWNNAGTFAREAIPALTDAYDLDAELPVWGGGNNSLPTGGPQDRLRSIAAVDADDNGKLDLVLLPSTHSTEARILLLDGTRTLPAQAVSIPTEGHPGVPDSVVTEDINRDGVADILFAVRTNQATYQSQPVYAVRYLASQAGKAPYYREETAQRMPENAPLLGEPISPTEPVRAGRQNQPTQPFALAAADYDSDGDHDIYIAGDMGGSLYYQNYGGVWHERTEQAGITRSSNGMGARVFDFNEDGNLDILSTENAYDLYRCPYQSTGCDSMGYGNIVFINDGNGVFTDHGSEYGPLRRTGRAWGFTSTDLNADGYLDFFIGNGEIAQERAQPEWEGSFNKPYLLLGGPDGWTEGTQSIWRNLSMPGTTVITASADFDGDQLPDLLVSGRESSAPYLLINRTENPGNVAMLHIRGAGVGASPRFGESARVRIRIEGRPTQTFLIPGNLSNYKVQSINTPYPIGLGNAETAIVEVVFPSKRTVIATVRAGEHNLIAEPPNG